MITGLNKTDVLLNNYLKTADSDWFKSRIASIMLFVLMAFAILFLRLFHLQVIKGKAFRQLSESNSIRMQSIDPPRGLIYDRKGELMVENRPSFNLYISPKDAKPLEATIHNLSQYMDISEETLQMKLKQHPGALLYKPILLKQDIERDTLAIIEVHKFDLPGITIDVQPVRHYLDDYKAPHLIGYMSEISPPELKRRKDSGYRIGDFIGKFGIERVCETFLRGKHGDRQVEVNVLGQVVRVINTVEGVPGDNVYLTIDGTLQKHAIGLLEGKVGAIIAMEPNTGHILALASSPHFDQNAFVSGMSHKQWSSLASNPHRPMENKGVQGEYPPASVFKIVTAIAGLEEGVIDEQTTLYCPGYYTYGNRTFKCWSEHGHGRVNVVQALAESCDVFFYQVGQKLGIEQLAWHSRASGFGALTGVDLEKEAKGLVPNTLWKKGRTGVPWQGGDTISVAIGQGYNLVTPIQVLGLTAAVANGGIRYKPLIVSSIESTSGDLKYKSQPEIFGKLSASKHTLEIVKKGLFQAVNSSSGTAWGSHIKGIKMCGKTGTAQVIGRKSDDTKQDNKVPDEHKAHAWFTAYAPDDNPKIAVTVIIEHGEHGSQAAAPIAKELVKVYLDSKTTDEGY